MNVCEQIFQKGGAEDVSEPVSKNVSNGTSTLQGEHQCQIILKSMHKCI